MRARHSKKYIKLFYDKIQFLEKNEIIKYEQKFFGDMEHFCNLYIITKFSFTIICQDWTRKGSETYYYKSFDEFMKIFKLDKWWRIPLHMLKE